MSGAGRDVAILLSTFRSERFLRDWLEDIARQSAWGRAELVVAANEASTSEREMLEDFRSRWSDRVQVLHVPRESLYASWNRCIDASSAPLLAIANVDDLRAPGSLESQLALLQDHPDAVGCYGPFERVTLFPSRTGSLVEVPPFERKRFTRAMCLGPFFVWRRSTEPLIRYFDEQFKSGGDFDFVIRLALAGTLVPATTSLGYYYDGGSGLSTGSVLQPVERTVIELRYGQADKIELRYVLRALRYDVRRMLCRGRWIPVHDIAPGYGGSPTHTLLQRPFGIAKRLLESLRAGS